MATEETSKVEHAGEEEFSFKYVPVNDFKRLVKSVRRQREKKREDARFKKIMRMEEGRKNEDVILPRHLELLSPYGPRGDADSFHQQFDYDEVEEVYEDEDFEDEQIEVDIPVLKGRVIQSARSQDTSQSIVAPSFVQTIDGNTASPPRMISANHEQTELSDIPVQFVQHSHRSYVRKVDDSSCLSSGRSLGFDGAGGMISHPNIGEDIARMEEQFSRMRAALGGIVSSIRNYKDDGLADDDEAMARVRKRSTEFGARFKRNYLFELRRQMGELKRGGRTGRLSGAVQTATQAVAALERAAPGVFLDGTPTPVHEFLTDLVHLAGHTDDFCYHGESCVIQEVEELSCQLDSLLLDFCPKQEKKKKVKKGEKRLPVTTPQKKKKKKDQYFMYRTNLNCFERAWKRRTQSLARAKFGHAQDALLKVAPKSAPRSGQPLALKADVGSGGTKGKESKMAARSRPRRNTTAIKECDVTTMMDTLSPIEADGCGPEEKRSASIECRSQPILPSASKNQNTEEAVPVVDEAVKTMLTDIMSEVLQQTSVTPGLPRKVLDRLSSPTCVISGKTYPSNVSLICVVEDKARAELQRRLRNHQLSLEAEVERYPKVAESRESSRFAALDYRHYFAMYRQSNPYYVNEPVSPCIMISEMTDCILDKEIGKQIVSLADQMATFTEQNMDAGNEPKCQLQTEQALPQ